MQKKIIHIVVCQAEGTDIQKVVHALAQEQIEQGCDVEIWCLNNPSFFLSTGYADLKVFDTYANPFALSHDLKVELKNSRDRCVIHLHGGFVPQFYSIVRLLKKHGRHDVIILSPHGAYNEHALRKLSLFRKIYFSLIEEATIKQSSLVHLLGPAEVNGYNRYTSKQTPFICLPYGKVLDGENRFPMVNHDGNKDPFVIAYSGPVNICANGLDILLNSFSTFVHQVYTPVELWIIANDGEVEELSQLIARFRISDYVRIKRFISESHRSQLLAQPHMFVNTSRGEAISSVALEAATKGLPMIVSEGSNISSYVKQHDAGWSLTHNTPDDLLQILHEAYVIYKTDDAAYTGLRRNSFHMVKESFNWRCIAKKWREVYTGFFSQTPR